MKLQKSTRFAIYSVLEFAAAPDRQIAATEVAERYGISPHHLAKVLRVLGKEGLVESVRGVGGGYRFIGNARRLTLMDIIELFEDIRAQTEEDAAEAAGHAESAGVAHALGTVLYEIDEIAKATFRSITIDTMLKLAERQRASQHAEPAGATAGPSAKALAASGADR